MAQLPRLLALESGGFYLQFEPKGQFQTRVRRASQFVLSENNFTRFEMVRAQNARNMVHIRTSFNNRFLRLGPAVGGGTNFLVATADEPEEDRSKANCTLFSFTFSNNRVGFRFQAPNAERAVLISNNVSLAAANTSSNMVLFGVIDLNTMVLLPRHVSFKGDNNMYLRARASTYLRFASSDRTDSRVHHISQTLRNGDVRLLSTRFNRTWRTLNNEWITCDGFEDNNPIVLFRPVRLSLESKTIALLSRGNNRYCMRWTGGSGVNYLAASATSPNIAQAVMTVEEAIRERTITDIRYDMENARIHSLVPVNVVPQIAYNYGPNTDHQTLTFSYQRVTEETFNSSHSWKVSFTSTIRVTIIPVLVTGNIRFHAGYTGRVEWSKTNREVRTISSTYIATVPPMSRVRVTCIVEQGSIDVPYTYKQRDILFDGTTFVRDMDDGLFTGLNTYQVRFIADLPQPLSNALDPNDVAIDPPSDLHQHNYDDNMVVTSTSPISSSHEDYDAYIVPPTSEIPSYPSSDDEVEVAPRSSKL